MRLSHLTTLSNGHVVHGLALAPDAGVLYFVNDVHAVNDFAEDDVLVI